MKTGTLNLRCPILTTMTLSIPYEIDDDPESTGQTDEMYTNDSRSLHMLGQSLLAYVYWKGDTVTVEKLKLGDLRERGEENWHTIGHFGFTNTSYVWISPQALHCLGEETILKDLPRAIKKLVQVA
ncbi:MAG: hypothetical protein JWL92_603 [Candidatus Nomurabacteria bacterium]|nr:hypothetical protein [Candidatus Nomurabacteria bacterium]